MNTRNFFDKHLRPNFEEWVASPIDERRAMNAIVSLNQMADWFSLEVKSVPSQTAFVQSLPDFRNHLARSVCREFQMIWDVADVHKHFELGRKSAIVREANKIGVQKIKYVEDGYWEDGYVEDQDELVVDLGGGELHSVIFYARSVYAMWERLLVSQGF